MRQITLCTLLALLSSSTLAEETSATKASNQAQAESQANAGRPRLLRRRQLHEHPTLLRMLGRNNALRQRVGLRPHRISPELTKAAQDHAVYMARTGQFSHYANGGPQARASKWGYRGMVRENIAWGQTDVNDAFQSWQTSSGHWASIVSHTTDAGFGYAVGNDGRGYWVAVYGSSSY